MPEDSVSGENCLPDLPIATYFLYLDIPDREKKRKKTRLLFLSMGTLISSQRLYPHDLMHTC